MYATSMARRAVLGIAIASMFALTLAGTARAQSIYYWYTPYGSAHLLATNTSPGNGQYAVNSVGANYLPGHLLSGGAVGDINSGGFGEYCNYYRMPALNAATSDPISQHTGLIIPAPVSSYQRQTSTATSGYNSGCQATTYQAGSNWISGWGWYLNSNDQGSDCYSTCGMHHTVGLAGTSNFPWSPAFGPGPQLTLKSEFAVNRYTTSGSPAGGWSYMCAYLQDMAGESAGTPRYIEYCMNRWRAQSNWGDHIDCASFTRSDGKGAAIPIVVANLTATSPYVINTWTPMVTLGDAGSIGTYHTFQGTITAGTLVNAVNGINAKCGYGHSQQPADYRLVGLENGLEAWRYVRRFGGNTKLFQAWTAY